MKDMTLEDFKANYLINDAKLLTLQLEYSKDNHTNSQMVTLTLNGRKVLSENKFEKLTFSLQFKGMIEFNYYDTFDCEIISQSTITKTSSGQFYLSLDPFNEDRPSEKDNMIIKSRELYFIDINNLQHQIT